MVRCVQVRGKKNNVNVREVGWLVRGLVLSFICLLCIFFFFFQAEDGIRDIGVTGVQTCALPIS